MIIKIEQPFKHLDGFNDEITIDCELFTYSELGEHHSAFQGSILDTHSECHKKCNQIAKLIKEVIELNTDK